MIANVRRRAASSAGVGIGPVCASLVRMGALTQAELDQFEEQGFVRLRGFADATTCQAMLDDVIAVTRAQAEGTPEPEALVLPEANLVGRDGTPEELAS